MIFKRDVFCTGDYCAYPDKVIIDVSKNEAERIIMLSKEVKRLKVYKIVEFDYSPEFSESGVENPDWVIDCIMLNVTDEEFFYTAIIEHTDIRIESRNVKIITLKKRMEREKNVC